MSVYIDGEFDEDGRLIVSDVRDKPPIGRECASACFCNMDEDGVLKVAGVRNVAPYKAKSVTLPGGTKKGRHEETKTREMENPFETALEEAEEEAGVRRLDGSRLSLDDYYPILLATVHDEPLRDEYGEPIMAIFTGRNGSKGEVQVRGSIPHFVFAHFGPVLLHETTDKKTKEPRLYTVREMIQRENGWSPKHIALTTQTLRFIGEGLAAFSRNEIEDERDRLFYEHLWQRGALSSSRQAFYTIEEWMKRNTLNDVVLDPHFALYEFYKNHPKMDADTYLHPIREGNTFDKFAFEPLLRMQNFDLDPSLLRSAKEKRQGSETLTDNTVSVGE